MEVLRTIADLRSALGALRGGGRTVGFVPTMGALHEGHLSLVRRARVDNDAVVLSIFVNPTQFNEAADLDTYPRQESADVVLAEQAGVDLVFAPSATEMYPEGFGTQVRVTGLATETLEGLHRGPGHFDGMTTVVAKLLHAVSPDAAYFGQKDAQQLVVVRQMVTDLAIPTRIVGCPTHRDPDGLAMSSRNAKLSAEERDRALAIPRSLAAAEAAVARGDREAAALSGFVERVLLDAGLEVEYVAIVNPATLETMPSVDTAALCAVAVRVGQVRLIDNTMLQPSVNRGG